MEKEKMNLPDGQLWIPEVGNVFPMSLRIKNRVLEQIHAYTGTNYVSLIINGTNITHFIGVAGGSDLINFFPKAFVSDLETRSWPTNSHFLKTGGTAKNHIDAINRDNIVYTKKTSYIENILIFNECTPAQPSSADVTITIDGKPINVVVYQGGHHAELSFRSFVNHLEINSFYNPIPPASGNGPGIIIVYRSNK